MFTVKNLSMDLGSANTRIMIDGCMVLNKPSVVFVYIPTNECLVAGELRICVKLGMKDFEFIWPLSQGNTVNTDAAKMLVQYFIDKVIPKKLLLPKPRIRMCISVPSYCKELYDEIVTIAAMNAKLQDVYRIDAPMAAAIGAGIDVMDSHAQMIVDIGGRTTEFAVITHGRIVQQHCIEVAGNVFDNDIYNFYRDHNINLGRTYAEKIKIAVGSALACLEEEPEQYVLRAPNRITTLPMEIDCGYTDIASCLNDTIAKIADGISSVLGDMPAGAYADIVKNGIWLTGGSSLLRGLSKRLEQRFNIPFHLTEDPLADVVRGADMALANLPLFKTILRKY